MTRKRFTDADYQVNASIVKANNKAIIVLKSSGTISTQNMEILFLLILLY